MGKPLKVVPGHLRTHSTHAGTVADGLQTAATAAGKTTADSIGEAFGLLCKPFLFDGVKSADEHCRAMLNWSVGMMRSFSGAAAAIADTIENQDADSAREISEVIADQFTVRPVRPPAVRPPGAVTPGPKVGTPDHPLPGQGPTRI